ncbi:hypothetical protein MHB42_05530 [Lysinibacillus sp. FSL K6-0232]|uniref:hypothetical protein n=1 Tax=Lysinibacillus sp. FSL K6-0232 TaxID=2921425 RepID=UPI0030FC5C84
MAKKFRLQALLVISKQLFWASLLYKGHGKNTYGIGCFILLNTEQQVVQSDNVTYTLEGNVFQLSNGFVLLRI